MRKSTLQILTLSTFLWIGAHSAFAQVAPCGYGGTAFTSIDASTMAIGTNYTPAACYYGGEYMPLLNVTAGDAFEIWTGTAFDSQITVFQEGNATNLANNDDNGPIQAGAAASVRFIAPVSGNYRVLMNVYNCATNTTCNPINIRKVYPWGGQGAGAQLPPCGSFSNLAVGSGTYTYFTCYQGGSYSVSTCTSAFDTHLTIYQLIGGVWRPIAYNNDNGPDCGGTSSSINFTAPTTTSDYIAIVNRADNHNNAPGFGIQRWSYHDFSGTSAVLKFRENAPGAPGAAPSGGTSVCQNVAVTLNRNSTPPAGITYHWVNAPGSTTSLGTGATYNPPTGTVGSVTYYVRPQSGSGCWGTASAGTTVTVTAPVGNPAVFGNNTWNVYAYSGGNINLTGVYSGYYVEPLLSYSTLNRWATLGSPSDASGYMGCIVGVDNHVVVSKRIGFPCGQYQLSMPNNDDDVQVYVNGNLVASGACCNSLTSVFWTGYLGGNSTIEVRHQEGGGGSNQSLTLTYVGGPPGNPATYGNGAWNVYAYNAGDAAGGSGAWSSNYAGFYTENNLSFATGTRWGTNDSPSYANNASGSAYSGCPVQVDGHSWSAKRTNIPCGAYNIQLVHDDIGQFYVNGVQVYTNATCCGTNNIGPLVITPSDQVEFRVSEGAGGSGGSLTFALSGTALAGGSITYGGSLSACANFDPPAFGNGGDASGGASGAVSLGSTAYQWQVNGGDIGSATAATYDPPTITTPGTYVYRRRATDKCGTVAYSNTVTITVTAQSTLPTYSGATPAPGNICQGQSVIGYINPGSGGGAGAADTYEYSTNGGSTWSPYTTGASINTATATTSVQIRVSRSAGTGTSCTAVGPSVIMTWPVSPQSTLPTLNTKTPNVAAICQGQNVSASINAGSGGGAGATDIYEYSTNGGGTWVAYTSGATINTASATTSVQVRVGRSSGSGTGCNAASPSVIATWTVTPQAVAPTLNTATPPAGAICQGQNVIATTNVGSGGSAGATDIYEYSTNGGSTWAAYTPGTAINTASATTSVQVRVSRSSGTGTGCNTAGPNVIVTWPVTPQAVLPTLNVKNPNVAAICQGQSVGATINAGSGGGAGAADIYEYSINGGSTWLPYTIPGTAINTASATGSVQIRVGRSAGSGTGCNVAGPSVIATWNVSPQPILATLNAKTPNVAGICPGTNVNATINAGSGGGSGAADTYEYSTNGGSTWTAYTSGSTINTASATTSVQVRVSRSGGAGTGCNNAGPSVIATWNINALPAAFTPVIVTTTPLCMGGNAQIAIPSSQNGVSYQLRNSAININAPANGTGGPIPLYTDNLSATSTAYDVVADLGGCTRTVPVPSIAVTAAPTALANNNDTRMCYVNGNNGYVEFVSANGAILAINPGTQNLGDVTVTEYVNGTPINIQACGTTQSQFVSAAMNRHWVVSSTVPPSGPLNVRLYFGNGDFTGLSLAAAANSNPNDDVVSISDLELNKYSGPFENATYTDNCGAGITTIHPATGSGGMTAGNIGYTVGASSYTLHNISSFSEFWLGGTNNVTPLPIVLTNFIATCDQGAVRLDWETATEINNEKFIIHRSDNMLDWEELTTVSGAGNSNQPLTYHTVDTRPLNGTAYYRLTQRDYNGDSETFVPISITCYADGKGNSMMVYPNPATERYTVAIQSVTDMKNVVVELTDLNGKRITINNVNVSAGENTFTFDVATLNPGTYFVTVKSDELLIKPVKLIVQ